MIFLDRDGTLNHDPGYISGLEQFRFYDFTIPALKLLGAQGNRFCIVTNQSGVARGWIKPEKLDEIHDFIRAEFGSNGIDLVDIYVCTDHPDQATEFRKPGGGMLRQAAAEHGLELGNCLMIGDSGKDIAAGYKLGLATMLVLTGEGQSALDELSSGIKPSYIAADLLAGAKQLLGLE